MNPREARPGQLPVFHLLGNQPKVVAGLNAVGFQPQGILKLLQGCGEPLLSKVDASLVHVGLRRVPGGKKLLKQAPLQQ